jgi:all-trans-retinol 13,14-reductase
MKYDCLIVGGGLSGMTTAIIMAQKGYHTALVEKSRQTAPTIRGFKRQGLFFDTGFHYTGGLDEGEPLDIFFRYLGLSAKIKRYPFDQEGFDIFRCLEPGFEIPFPCGYGRIQERLSERFPKERKAIEGYLQAVKHTFRSQPYFDLDQDMNAPEWSMMNRPSLREVLDRTTADEMLKSILSMHCLLHGVPPEEGSFTNHAVVAGSYYESANGILGGGLSLAEAFDERLKELGVDVYCGREVKEILLSADQGVSGIRLGEDEILQGQYCISTIHPRHLLTIVPGSGFRPIYRNRLERLEDTFSAIIVYAKSSLPLQSLARANLFLFPTPRTFGSECNGPVEGNPLFITRARQDEGTTPQEGCVIICPVPHTGSDHWKALFPIDDPLAYQSYRSEMSRRIIEHLTTSCPEFQGRITEVDCATPRTLKHFTNSPVGSLYGVKHKIEQVNPLPVTKIKGLFLAGQSITAPGLLGAVYSGFLACGNIVGHRKFRGELKAWA